MQYPPHIHGPTVEWLRGQLAPHIPADSDIDLDELFYAVALEFAGKYRREASKEDQDLVLALTEAARQLVHSDRFPAVPPQVFERLVVEEESPLLLRALQGRWALEIGTDITGTVERAIALAERALSNVPSPTVQPYLRRLARCVLLGLSPEAVIMCRAVLEIALAETVCLKEPGTRLASEDGSWGEQLDRALGAGWLTKEEASRAREIRRLGNKAVHKDPGLVDGLEWEAFRDTMALLEKLAAA